MWGSCCDPPWHRLFSILDASSFSVLSGQLWPEAQALFGLESEETRRKKCLLVWVVLGLSGVCLWLQGFPCQSPALALNKPREMGYVAAA